jgi:hypothetical protein
VSVATAFMVQVNKSRNSMILKKLFYLFIGANLRTGEVGIFPLAHVVDIDYNYFDPELGHRDDKKERYLLDYLGSVETSMYKGNIVLCQAVRKISRDQSKSELQLCQPHSTVLEISDKGIKMLDKVKTENVSWKTAN